MENLTFCSPQETHGDECPIIFYEPNIGFKPSLKTLIQSNPSISLLSEFEIAFEFSQSLKTSFLMITSIHMSEKKLLQNLPCLKDFHAERLLDFMEESVLTKLFNSIPNQTINSFKVYLFHSKKDFENNPTLSSSTDEEEMMLMCSIEEMANQFREDFTILWCDPNMTLETKEFLMKEIDIDEKNIYTNFEDLRKKINHYTGLPYHLILSGKIIKLELILDHLDQFKDLLCCYIYNNPVKFNKTKDIQSGRTLKDLVLKIKEGIRTKAKYKNIFPVFATHFGEKDMSYINKVHHFLRGFVNFTNRKQAQRDFMSLAKMIYQSSKLCEFEKKYCEYNKDQILNWYTQETPIYKLINNCLRISTSDSIFYCRFILKDLEQAIREEYNQENRKFHGVLYRGTFISKEELEKLKTNIGKEIEMYGFLSTSPNLKTAIKFLNTKNKNPDNNILITIFLPSFPSPEIDVQGFANITKFSQFKKEDEILFNVRSRFQVLEVGTKNIRGIEYQHLALLYGAHLLRKYMTIQKPVINLNFKLPQELKCHLCLLDNNLFVFQKERTQIICKQCVLKNSTILKNIFLFPIIKEQKETHINIEFRGKILKENKTNKNLVDFYGYQCDDCSNSRQEDKRAYYKMIDPKTETTRTQCSSCFESSPELTDSLLLSENSPFLFWESKQKEWERVDTYFKIQEFERCQEMTGADIFYKGQEYQKCREFCRKNLIRIAKKRGNQKNRIGLYENLGKSCHRLGEYKKALESYFNALNLRRWVYEKTHPSNATLDHYIAEVYKSRALYKKALKYYGRALGIRKGFYHGKVHPSIADSYNDIAIVYNNLGKYQKALKCHKKALEIRESVYGAETHPDLAISYDNIAQIHYSLGEYQKSLEYHKKALDIRESIFSETHFETATSYHNLGEVYQSLEQHEKAKYYFAKALEIKKPIFFGEIHPAAADSYASVASIYRSLSNYQKSIQYHTKALCIRNKVFGEIHHSTADSKSNLAFVYNDLGEYKTALKYQQEALNIIKSIYGETHPDTATLYEDLAEKYKNLGQDKKALESQERALNIRKSIFDEKHPSIATSYNNLASMYNHLGNHEKALDYHMKAFKIRKIIYGKIHPNVADSYNNLASVNFNLGRYQNALIYFLKALEITKHIFKEENAAKAELYCKIAVVYSKLDNYQKALEYNTKALDIQNKNS